MKRNMLRISAPVVLAAAFAVACQERPGNRADQAPDRNEAKVDDSKLHDAGITARIDTAYMVNPHLSAVAIDVDTDHGVVTLAGKVPSDVHRDLAVSIARSADGVRDVHDRLTVTKEKEGGALARNEPAGPNRSFGQAVKDATITASVKMHLATGKGVSASRINVDTRGGHVTLTGQVPTEAERQLAVRIARDTDGVREVTNQIQVTRG